MASQSLPSNYHKVESPEDLQAKLSAALDKVSVLYFRTDWAEPCKTMDGVMLELAKRYEDVLFLSVEAEALPDISESFEVDAVPYFILLRGHTLLTRLSGAQPSVLSAALKSHASKPSALSASSQQPLAAKTIYQPDEKASGAASASGTVAAGGQGDVEESDEELAARCDKLMKQSDVVLFMKGDRETPRCGFSQKIVGILDSQKIDYSTFDILQDEGVRQKLKEINEWPTFPQLIIKGEFVGGLDVVKEMEESGELQEMLQG
ncbi:Monothiol glutaredoxin-3 [Rhodotorula toruloides]|uniref:BY PROTMAP: gi/472581538/gb/EMS19272.1/ monothiol glutaredoxin-5 [Rhodosporidium toruloides NP11] gi/647397009/emb/CDR39776.1/ RHTO0S04e09208g1_1 [Rhodosporidium toruloides] n=1 Tax=Rhodotorula toruloides TaxID=5286 RepID=A0A0K3CBJ8_RHOTO|nr:Monothiol glutaredoxin-3 [Rhodotorula toruloides]PRQ77722.1 Thioredoxin-like fold [Rhodotorula toruloides]